MNNFDSFPRTNNFDLIRLLAAMQVVVFHGIEHLQLQLPYHEYSYHLLASFPGVPIFFLISGFLISASYLKSTSLKVYAFKRFLRLYPALIICFLVSCVLVLSSGYFAKTDVSLRDFAFWTFSQLSILQFFNPEFLRAYGVGVVNGSLWTIPVEIQFYILTPVIMYAFIVYRKIFYLFFVVFIICNFSLSFLKTTNLEGGKILKLFQVSFLPWIYMFFIGIFANMHWNRTMRLFEGKFVIWLIVYLAIVLVGYYYELRISGNTILFPWVLILSGLVLSAVFSKPNISAQLINGQDISYGTYIYHMPIFNLFIEMGIWENSQLRWLALMPVIILSILSWYLIEKPSLQLKSKFST